jgi:hypothetical protein
MPDVTVHTYDEDGQPAGTVTIDVPEPAPSPVLEAVATARAEVAGYSESNGTRQAVEALATAVEALVQGAIQ